MSWKTVEERVKKGPVATAKVVFLGILLLGIIGLGVGVIFKPFDIISKVTNSDRIINNYEWFQQQYHDIIAIELKIAIADKEVIQFKIDAGVRKDWTFEDKNELSRLQSISSGLKYQANDMIAQYNAKSKMITRSLWKSSELPFNINPL